MVILYRPIFLERKNRHTSKPTTSSRRVLQILTRNLHIKLAQTAGIVYHNVLNWPDYEGIDKARLNRTLRFIMIPILTGALGKLTSNTTERCNKYAWSASCDQLHGFAEIAVTRGLLVQNIVLAAARIWGGLPPSFSAEIGNDQQVLGIVCPQTTILMNILSQPEAVAKSGLDCSLFEMHKGSVPIIPRHHTTGLVLAANKPFRRPATSVDARTYIPHEGGLNEQGLLFTIEPITGDDGRLAALMCAWQHGDVVLELNPYTTMCNLKGSRSLDYYFKNNQPPEKHGQLELLSVEVSRPMTQISARELLSFSDGFEVHSGLALVRVGPRPDLQIASWLPWRYEDNHDNKRRGQYTSKSSISI